MRSGIATLNNVFKLYDSETGRELDGAVTVQLPAFELQSATYKGAGAAGEVNVPAPGVMNAQTVTISVPVIYGSLVQYMQLGSTKTLDLRNELVVNNKDNHQVEKVPNRWVLKGPLSKSDPGKVEQAAASDATIDFQVYYAQHWLDGESVLEWDVFKCIHTVNGVDMMQTTRQNIMVGG